MKKIESLLLRGAAYSTLIMSLYYLFAIMTSPEVTVSFPRFLWIVLFGYVIAVAGFVLDMVRVSGLVKIIVHYAILLAAFLVVFLVGMSYPVNSTGTVFALVIIFTLLYVFLSLLIHFSKKLLGFADEKITSRAKAPDKKEKKDKKKDGGYTPKFN